MDIFLRLFFLTIMISANIQFAKAGPPLQGLLDEKVKTSDKPQNRFSVPTEISYSIEPYYDVNAFRFTVVLTFKGDSSGETKIKLPNNFGSDRDINGIKFLKSLSENTFIENTDKPEIKIVKYTPGAIIRINYQIEQVRNGEPELGNHYMTTINAKYFHFLGETFFVIPDWDNSSEIIFHIYWKNFPQKWNLANSFGVNNRNQDFKTRLWKLLHSVYVGGDFRIIQRYVYNNPVFIAIKGKWDFSDAQFCDLAQTIIREERDFWNDFNFPFYLITIYPINGDNDQGGTGRVNSYALFLSKDRQLDYRLRRLLAHETFHTWLGDKILFNEPEALLYWFKEGFSDYYARLLLLRAGLISFDDYVAEYNKVLGQYYKSPVREEKNERIAKDFWSDGDIKNLPYQRGDIIAHNLNAAIIKNSQGDKSLDDLMKNIYQLSKNESFIVSTGGLTTLIRFYGGEQILADIMKVLNSGIQIKPNYNAMGPCMKLEMRSMRKLWLFGEQYDLPSYKIKNENQIIGKDCLEWFGIK
jgi:predicted metalloprotease with PDZ domain